MKNPGGQRMSPSHPPQHAVQAHPQAIANTHSNGSEDAEFFPTKGGVSDAHSPKAIMDGEHLSMKTHLCSPIGAYCQVHEEDAPRNSQLPRTKGTICMAHSGNAQGGFKFMTLRSGKKVTRRSWDELPMTDTVIDRVNELGKDQPEILVFKDRKG